MKKDKVEL